MKKIILNYAKDHNGYSGFCIFDKDENYVGVLYNEDSHLGLADNLTQPEPKVIEKEVEKIVYRDPPEQKTPPQTVADLPKVTNAVDDLIKLKEAGFSVEEILELRSEHLI